MQTLPQENRRPFAVSIVLLGLAIVAGLVLSVLSALHVCSDACRETAKFAIFGLDFGWFGIGFFLLTTVLFAVRGRFAPASWLLSLVLLAAAGAELRFIWLQKYVIGAWCPVCLGIAATVFTGATLASYRVVTDLTRNGGTMKSYGRYLVLATMVVVVGLTASILGVRQEAEAAPANDIYLGKTTSGVTVYFVSDWFCPACRALEPQMEKMYPEIAGMARVAFVDFPIHPETSNFTPYNLQFLMYEKGKYIPLRTALAALALKTKAPTNDQVQAAIASTGVKLRQLNFMDVMNGVKLFESIYRGFGVTSTPTVVVANDKTKKKILLVGDNQITKKAITEAIASVRK
ncbi:MAG TPA: thioredoxin domain-containing protein [Geobacteraceae bacterium]